LIKHLNEKQKVLSRIPSVDELLKSPEGARWLSSFPRKIVIRAIRAALEAERVKLLAGQTADIVSDALLRGIDAGIKKLSSCSLLPLINATGIVLHTNLGRAVLSEKALENVVKVGGIFQS
jgi:L-seryl-tRNA(Ser) seleniumtransferase